MKTEKKKKGEALNDSLDEKIKLQEEVIKNEQMPTGEPIQMILRNINMSLPRGTCSALIGKVSSGKSSLLCALLGEMYFSEGTSLKIDKKIAYVSQQSWSMTKTIKENITMGAPWNAQRFGDALKYSCFVEDLNDMPNRELTVIGNKGVNLSGGQKARLAIARALYSDADVYLFDDPISALDINVGKSIMENCILGYLKSKTVLVATHALAYLPYFHKVYVMEEGEIILEGKFDDLSKNDTFNEIFKLLEEDHKHAEEETRKKEIGEFGPESMVTNNLQIDPYEVPNREEVPISQATLQIERKQSKALSRQSRSRRNSVTSVESRVVLLEDKIVNDAINIEDKAKGVIQWKVVKSYFSMIGFSKFMIMLLCKL